MHLTSDEKCCATKIVTRIVAVALDNENYSGVEKK